MAKRQDLSKVVRDVCLSLPETSEVQTWGHPSFRAGSKTFAALEVVNGRPSLAVRVQPLEVDVFRSDDRFFATPYGRGQWISIWLDLPPQPPLIRDLLMRAYRIVANKRMLAALDGKDPAGDDRLPRSRR